MDDIAKRVLSGCGWWEPEGFRVWFLVVLGDGVRALGPEVEYSGDGDDMVVMVGGASRWFGGEILGEK